MMTDIDPANEADFNRWYEEEHLDERMAIPGFINARRFTALEGGPKYLALYDLESPEVLQSAPYRHIVGAGKSAWTKRMEGQFSQLPPQRVCRLERAEAVSASFRAPCPAKRGDDGPRRARTVTRSCDRPDLRAIARFVVTGSRLAPMARADDALISSPARTHCRRPPRRPISRSSGSAR